MRLAASSGAPIVAAVFGALACLPLGSAASGAPCSGNYAHRPTRAAGTLRFGIDPEVAGTGGIAQGPAAPVNQAKALQALRELRPDHKQLVLRVNRLFESDGAAGIRRFERIVDRYTRAKFETELQVRYHPSARQRGNIAAWTRYVRHVVDVFGPNRRVIAMAITNEINLPFSPNTSDGAYPHAERALIAGVIAAHREARRRGFKQLEFGFTFAYRFNPATDAAMFTGLRRGGTAFREALGFIGVDFYPELYPGLHSGVSLPSATVPMLATMRRCFVRLGGLAHTGVPLWVTENGYDITPGSITGTQQRRALVQMVGAIRGAAGTYGVTDYRWFNLRDNLSTSTGFAQTTGLLTDDYRRKPSFAAYRKLVARFGARCGRRR